MAVMNSAVMKMTQIQMMQDLLNSPENLTNLFNQFNDFSSDQNENSDNIKNCKHDNIDEFHSLNKLNGKHSLFLFQLNLCSISKKIEDLESAVDSTKICLFTAIIETRIVKDKFPVNDIYVTDYSYIAQLSCLLKVLFNTSELRCHINQEITCAVIKLQD